jgi:hypothetical protein
MARSGPQTHDSSRAESIGTKSFTALYKIQFHRSTLRDGKVISAPIVARAGDDDDEDESNPRDPGYRAF